MLWGCILSMVKAQSSIEVSNAPIRSLQPGTSLDVEAYEENGEIVVEYRVETTAEFDGVWTGFVDLVDEDGTRVAEEEISGFVDALDDPPFTEGVVRFPDQRAAEAFVTFEEQDPVQASDSLRDTGGEFCTVGTINVTPRDDGEDFPLLGLALLGGSVVGAGLVVRRVRER